MRSIDVYSMPKYKSPSEIEFFYVVDYDKAKDICNKVLSKDRDNILFIEYGLDGDWDSNSDVIWEYGEFNDECDFYPKSYWAIPKLRFLYASGKELILECYNRENNYEI